MYRLKKVENINDIPADLRDTPVEDLLKYHNLSHEHREHSKAELLIGMCMDNRNYLDIPNNFAYIMRTGGGNLRFSEFKVSYAIAVGGIRTIVLIGHNNCGMVNLSSKKEKFIEGLIEIGWEKVMAEEHFMSYAPLFEIGNEIDFLLSEVERIDQRYPKVKVIPMFYKLDDHRLYFVESGK